MPESGSTNSGLRSIAPGQQPVRDAAKRIGAAAERREGFHGPRVQKAYLLLRGADAEDGGVSGLATLAVGACRLAESRGVREHIEQVVLDLEREPDRGRKTSERLLEPRLERRHARRAHHDTGPDQRPGLQGVHLLDLIDGELAAFGLEIDRLTASHAETADGAREELHQA